MRPPLRVVAVRVVPVVLAALSLSLTPGRAVAATLADGLLGYWRLDDGAGSAKAIDSSDAHHDGVLRGADPATAWSILGHSGGSLLLTGTDWIQIPGKADLEGFPSLTVAAWVFRQAGTTDYNTVISQQEGMLTAEHFTFGFDPQQNLFLGIEGRRLTVNPPPPEQWFHIAGTYDGQMLRLYTNGQPVGVLPWVGAVAPEFKPVLIGANANNATDVANELFLGRLDEVVLYRRALDASEIGLLAANGPLPLTDGGAASGGDAGTTADAGDAGTVADGGLSDADAATSRDSNDGDGDRNNGNDDGNDGGNDASAGDDGPLFRPDAAVRPAAPAASGCGCATTPARGPGQSESFLLLVMITITHARRARRRGVASPASG